MDVVPTGFGPLLRRWRTARRLSQLDLSLEARISSRHLSFLETGRAKPSREMVLALCTVLDVPARDRNALLLAAGFAPAYSETELASPQAEQARWALQLLLRQQEPFAAVAFDREWNVLMANAGWLRFAAVIGQPLEAEPYTVLAAPRLNLLRAIFEDGPLRRSIENFDLVAATLLARLEREVDSAPVREILNRPDLAALRATADPRAAQAMILPVDLRLGDVRARFFTTIATLGTAQDVTLQELRLETFHPADPETEKLVRSLAT